jgi:hypothetical protein
MGIGIGAGENIVDKSTRAERHLRSVQRHLDEQGRERRTGAAAPATASPKSKKHLWLLLTLCLVGSGIVSFLIFRPMLASTPQELVGTWKVVQGPLQGATMQFRPNGTAVLSKGKPGDEDHFAVKVENNKIFLSGKDARTGKNDTFVQTIISLKEDELIIRDEDKITYRMTRVRN